MTNGGRRAAAPRRRACAVLVPLPLLLVLALALPARAATVYRLAEHSREPTTLKLIDGVWMRTLAPFRRLVAVPLDGAPSPATLRFSIGIEPGQTGATLFQVIFVPASGPRVPLYRRELSGPGWHDDQVDLGARDMKGAALILAKSPLGGDRAAAQTGVWGEPIVLPSAAARTSPSVILISIDTLRADAVGIYGAPGGRTPAIDALARAGVWYTNSYSASSWTYPSHGALLRGVTAGSLPDPARGTAAVSDGARRSLAEIYRAHGYQTAGFTGGGFLSMQWGFPEGFDAYFEYPHAAHGEAACRPERFDGAAVFARAGRWLERNAAHPFFLFVHTYDVHDRCPVQPPGLDPFAPWPDPGAAKRREVADYYARKVGEVDALLAAFLRRVDALGLAEHTVVMLTADHGEAFWEHGVYGHGCSAPLYDPVLRVPLIVRAPRLPARGVSIEPPVSAIDVAPTLLALTGHEIPPAMEGKALPGLGLAARAPSDPVFAQCGDHLAVRVGTRKLITARRGGAGEVYDLAQDAAEKSNIIGRDPALDAVLLGHAREYWKGATAETALQLGVDRGIDSSTRERLRALGYVE